MVSTLPRILIAAPASGHGKTTVTIGLMAALRRLGKVVAPGKVGPDYIDPGYHELATERPGRNLDPFLVGPQRILPLLRHAATTPSLADVVVIEGVMGLFDGRLGGDGFASSAHVAALTASPVLLVVDVRHAARTVGAVVHGMATYELGVHVSGVILNQVGSARHATEVHRAIEQTGIPVVGVLPRDAGVEAPSRHLGLVPVQERPGAQASLERLADLVAAGVDLEAVLQLAQAAPDLPAGPIWQPEHEVSLPAETGVSARSGDASDATGHCRGRAGPVVAMAAGRAFSFRYPETEELLTAAGCTVATFDPLHDDALPAGAAALYLGGGFPQVYAGELAANERLRAQVAQAAREGLPIYAECAGLLFLCREVDGRPMTGVVPATATMSGRLTMGYRHAVAAGPTLVADPEHAVTGHEFHRTQVHLEASVPPAWHFQPDAPTGGLVAPPAATDGAGRGRASIGETARRRVDAEVARGGALPTDGVSLDPAGLGHPTVHAGYLHVHWAGQPWMAERFAAAAHAWARTNGSQTARSTTTGSAPTGSETTG